jgi:hypothetical protein
VRCSIRIGTAFKTFTEGIEAKDLSAVYKLFKNGRYSSTLRSNFWRGILMVKKVLKECACVNVYV